VLASIFSACHELRVTHLCLRTNCFSANVFMFDVRAQFFFFPEHCSGVMYDMRSSHRVSVAACAFAAILNSPVSYRLDNHSYRMGSGSRGTALPLPGVQLPKPVSVAITLLIVSDCLFLAQQYFLSPLSPLLFSPVLRL